METELRAALLEWLRTGPAPLDRLNAVEEEAPLRASPPWLGIVASASADWSTKTQVGREVRVAIELQTRSDDVAGDGGTEDLPRLQEGFQVAAIQFLRARAERRPNNRRAVLLEYRFRCLETQPE
jgi:hypothetical protein